MLGMVIVQPNNFHSNPCLSIWYCLTLKLIWWFYFPLACSPLCSSCIGSKSTDCKDCIPGYEKTDSNETTSSCQG